MLTRWSNMVSPDFPGYFPTMLAEVKSNSVAPNSVHTALTSMCFPDPCAPAMSTERTAGPAWCIWSLSIGNTQLSLIACRTSPSVGLGSLSHRITSQPAYDASPLNELSRMAGYLWMIPFITSSSNNDSSCNSSYVIQNQKKINGALPSPPFQLKYALCWKLRLIIYCKKIY